ncbi:uncharacterized protein JCM6883_007374 [Sporobolomyces salmoneus]|uniref:uncharacterized protein n=1 Tax=Sporobolomyces salmoneus TaxID=183962 RepID=UPI003174D731
MQEETAELPSDWNQPQGRPTRQAPFSLPDPATLDADSPVAPIAIASPTSSFSSSAHSFNLRSPPTHSSSFSPASDNPAVLLDGPLTDLLPPAIGSPTSGSSTDGGSLKEWVNRENGSNSSTTRAPTARRIVSAPLGLWSTSPPSRSSPLAQSFSSMLEDESFLLPRYPASPPSSFRTTPIPSSHRRRRSSASLHNPPFGSLVGSFENSLLSGRMSALPSKPLPFVCSIGVLGSRDAPTKLQCPSHLHVDFGAVFYSSKEDRKTSPYVGTVDLEGHFISLLSPSTTTATKLPRFPGYQVPVRGQVQIVLKNSNQTAFKPFLVPYDLEGLNRNGRGGRTFLRQKSYSVEREDAKGTIRFAIHLTFCSPPLKRGSQKEPKYYLYQSIRLVFDSQAFDPREKVRVVLEGPAEFLHGSKGMLKGGEDEEDRRRWRESQFGDYKGPGEEWEMTRRDAKAALSQKEAKIREGGARRDPHEADGGGEDSMSISTDNPSHYTPSYDIPPTTSAPASSFSFANLPSPIVSPLYPPPPVSTTTTLPPHRHPLSMSTTFSSPVSPVFPPLHPLPISFDRVPSPISSDLTRTFSRDRKQSGVSGLSLSRPSSPALFQVATEETREVKRKASESRERELCGR